VKRVFPFTVSMATGFDLYEVPGATPKNPASGLMACSRPLGRICIQEMSSPMISAFQPGTVGLIMARLVLPHAEGKAPARWYVRPSGLTSRRISMCSANQPSRLAMAEAMRRLRHFFPRRAFPPYPDP
jgi:hypothetical protein